MSEFKSLLQETREALTSLRRNNKVSGVRSRAELPIAHYALPPSVAHVFNKITADVERDIHVYDEKRHRGDIPTTELDENKPTSVEEAVEQSLQDTQTESTADTSQYVQKFTSQANTSSWFDHPENELENRENLGELSTCELNLYKLFSKELLFNSTNIKNLNTSVTTVNNIKKATQAIGYGRVSDAITILRNAKRDDAHNKSIAFCLSQLLFYRAHNGGSEYLPEAQSEARRACISDDNDPHPKTLEYRYQTLTQEIHFHSDKIAEMARDWYITSDDYMMGDKGLFVHEGYHLKTWILLSKVSVDQLETFDISALANITSKTIGGMLFYTHYFKENINKALKITPDGKFKPLAEVEQQISQALNNYEKIQQSLALHLNEDRSIKGAANKPWILEVRYLEIFLQASEVPSFAEIMLHSSLDGRKSDREAYPTKSLHAAGLSTTQYWHAWGLAVTPSKDMHSDVTLPIERISLILPILRKCDQLLLKLREFEQSIIPDDKFQIIVNLMPPYEYRVFIDIIAGGLAFKAPEDSYYMPLYRKWGTHPLGNPRPHVIVTEHAKKGAFVSAEEVLTVFEGIQRIITDRNHGLKARARKALKACTDHQAKKGIKVNQTALLGEHFSDYWMFYLLVLPFILIIVITVLTASNYIDALLHTLILSLIFAGVFSVIWIFNDAAKNTKK